MQKQAQVESSWMKKNLTLNTLKITEPVRTPRVSLEYLVKLHPLDPSDVETVHTAIKEMELPANVSCLMMHKNIVHYYSWCSWNYKKCLGHIKKLNNNNIILWIRKIFITLHESNVKMHIYLLKILYFLLKYFCELDLKILFIINLYVKNVYMI